MLHHKETPLRLLKLIPLLLDRLLGHQILRDFRPQSIFPFLAGLIPHWWTDGHLSIIRADELPTGIILFRGVTIVAAVHAFEFAAVATFAFEDDVVVVAAAGGGCAAVADFDAFVSEGWGGGAAGARG